MICLCVEVSVSKFADTHYALLKNFSQVQLFLIQGKFHVLYL